MRTEATDVEKRQSIAPNSTYYIGEAIKTKKYDEAQAMCDQNVDFYRSKIQDQQDLFIRAERARKAAA